MKGVPVMFEQNNKLVWTRTLRPAVRYSFLVKRTPCRGSDAITCIACDDFSYERN